MIMRRTAFGKRFAPKGWGFPRRYSDGTPQESLFDPDRILGGRDVQARATRVDETIVRQPRVESTRIIEDYRKVRPIAPATEIPYVRAMPHLEPSRDAEFFYAANCVEVAPTAIVPVLTMETINNHSTIFRWIKAEFFDGLEYTNNFLFRVRVEGSVEKFLITSMVGGGAATGTSGSSSGVVIVTGWFNLWNIPESFHNVLFEVVDSKTVIIEAQNVDDVATRKICVKVWGWIESTTRFTEAVQH